MAPARPLLLLLAVLTLLGALTTPSTAVADHRHDQVEEAVETPPAPEPPPAPAPVPVADEFPGVTAAPGPAAVAPAPAALPPITGPINPAAVPYGGLIATTARRHGVPVALFTALVWQESGFKPRARSRVGARGLTQLMPATARSLGVRDSYDPAQNLAGGARYLALQLVRFRSKRLALAAYNAGPGAVRRFRGVPPYPETRAYVRKVLG